MRRLLKIKTPQMTHKKLTLLELLQLIEMEDYRGIISMQRFVAHVTRGVMPKVIKDVRGALRLTINRDGEHFSVTQHNTPLALETVGAVY